MIRFVDLETGNTFDGSIPYVFWINGEQSVNIIYSQPICFISLNQQETISMENNPVFKLIDIDKLNSGELSTLYDFEYHNMSEIVADVIKDENNNEITKIISYGTKHHNYYVHMIYVLTATSTAGEYIVDFKIGDEVYRVGGDFYDSDESLKINLINNGIEIPDSIQKAIYGINVHEENIDNITLNRKWKELLSNMWDVVANKGSYKSLFNSLKWFEYGDSIRLCEIWKNLDTNKYFVKEIQQLFSSKYSHFLNGYTKTTYLSLCHALQQHIIKDGKIVLDDEKNPVLENIVSKWSIQDLSLKMCMLGHFYKTYFMPIHLNLLHATIEDVVYTNTFKVRQNTIFNRVDDVCYCEDIKCNVNDGDIFRLGRVQCYVYPETLFGSSYSQDMVIMGVQRNPETSKELNDKIGELRDYAAQLYNEIGAIVDFNISIPETTIKREVLVFKTYSQGKWVTKTMTEYKLFKNSIKFSLLCPVEGEYEIKLQLDTLERGTFVKKVRFKVFDTEHTNINIYRVQNYGTLNNCYVGQPCQINDYIYSRRSDGNTGLQYIPAKSINPYQNKQWNYKGVCLNHLLIFNDCKYETDKYLNTNYFVLKKNNNLVCISKQYGFKPNISEDMKKDIYRNDYIFMPEFHTLVPLALKGKELDIDSYKVTDDDTLCIIPEISYGKEIEECDWEFINASRPDLQPIKLPSIKEPFIANNEKSLLPKGYYNIVFRYRLTGENKTNTIKIDSAFIKV